MMNSKLILASASPQRLELLKQIGIIPEAVDPADIDETPLKYESAKNMVLRLARAKCEAVSKRHPGKFVLAADSTVLVGRTILEKARDEAEARKFLIRLSGRTQKVWGGIAVITPDGKCVTRAVCTSVKFKRLSDCEINAYIASNEWRGKAGAYGIQGKAAAFVASIRGSYTNIIGLSLYDIMNILNGNGFRADGVKDLDT